MREARGKFGADGPQKIWGKFPLDMPQNFAEFGPMKTVITDAGRSKTHPHESQDCVVRALATAFDVPYSEAHAFVRGLGRPDGGCAATDKVSIGLASNTKQDEWGEGCDVRLFAKFHKIGTYILVLWNGWSQIAHMICMKDGEAYDTERLCPENVWWAWRVPKGAILPRPKNPLTTPATRNTEEP